MMMGCVAEKALACESGSYGRKVTCLHPGGGCTCFQQHRIQFDEPNHDKLLQSLLNTLPGKEVQNVGLVELLSAVLANACGLGLLRFFSFSSVEGVFFEQSLCVQDNFHFCPAEVLKCK